MSNFFVVKLRKNLTFLFFILEKKSRVKSKKIALEKQKSHSYFSKPQVLVFNIYGFALQNLSFRRAKQVVLVCKTIGFEKTKGQNHCTLLFF